MSESKTTHILYVEDDLGSAWLFQKRLEQAGYAVDIAHDGEEGLAMCDALAYDVVAVDQNLPIRKGLDVIRSLASRRAAPPTIMIADIGDEQAAVEAIESGASDYLVKDAGGWYLELLPYVIEQVLHRQRLAEEKQQASKTVQRRNLELALLNLVGQKLSSTLDLDQVLITALEEVRRLMGVIACTIWLTDPQTGELVCRQNIGPHTQILRGWRLQPGKGLVGWAARHGQSVNVPDTRTDERHFKGVDRTTGVELRSILCVPLRAKQAVIGVLQVVDTLVGRFDSADLTLLESLAASAAIAIENARLYEQAQQEIAERKQAQEALHQRTVELQARNEELDAFAHTVAHDLQGVVTRIMGYAVLLEDGTTPVEELYEYLHIIGRDSRKMGNVIDALLLLAGVHKMDVQLDRLDMASIVAEALQRLSDMIEEHQAEIVVPAASAWPVAWGYGPWVEEVWVNYISNAIKYGGRPPRVELGWDEGSSFIRFWVRDNGAGLRPEERSRLFVPFTQLNQVDIKGYGLGLSIVRRIVDKLGGQVGVESQVGQGSVFSFTLPGDI